MAHRVTATIWDREIGKSGVEFLIRTGERRFGWLYVSKGGVTWYSRNKRNPISFNWRGFEGALKRAARTRQ